MRRYEIKWRYFGTNPVHVETVDAKDTIYARKIIRNKYGDISIDSVRLLNKRNGSKRLRSLTDEQVREIRRSNESTIDLANRFNVAHGVIYQVRIGRSYKGVQ